MEFYLDDMVFVLLNYVFLLKIFTFIAASHLIGWVAVINKMDIAPMVQHKRYAQGEKKQRTAYLTRNLTQE